MKLSEVLECVPGRNFVMVVDADDEPLFYGNLRDCQRAADESPLGEADVLVLRAEGEDGDSYIVIEVDV